MVNAAFFPLSSETLPVAMYINKYSTKYRINTFLAFPGSGLCGKDIGKADNRPNTGFIAYNCFQEMSNTWTHLLIVGQSDFYHSKSPTYMQTIELIICALACGKMVICSAKLDFDELSRLSQHSNYNNFIYIYKDPHLYNPQKLFQLYKPSPYIVFCGGLFCETNSFEPFLFLSGELSKKYQVFSFSTSMNSEICGIPSIYSLLYDSRYLEEEKIYAINSFVRKHTELIMPDIILVHLAEPMMAYNDKITNGFGILPLIVSKALSPNYFICGFPITYGHTSYINSLSEGMFNQYGFEIDYVHLVNVEIDSAISFEEKNIILYTTYDIVEAQKSSYCLDSQINVDNLLRAECFEKVLADISTELSFQTKLKPLI